MKTAFISADVQALMAQAQQNLAARLHVLFQTAPLIAVMGAERAARFAAATATSGTEPGAVALIRVARAMRDAIGGTLPDTNMRPGALWHIVDAIGCLEDCMPGRWQYMTDAVRRARLSHLAEEVEVIEKAVAQASAA